MSYKELFVLFLVLHKRLGEKSSHYIYLQSLPVNYTNPSLWTDEQIKRLGLPLQKMVGVEQKMLESNRSTLNAWLVKIDDWRSESNLLEVL